MADASLPSPLVPPHVDLAGYGFMPLYGHRLFGSDFNAHSSDAEWRAGVTLWWSSWNQVPAASLPSDDVALTRLAGLGRDVRGWRKMRNNALRGFVLCSDGRLYHPVLAKLAIEAWDRRVRDRERKAKWRERINLSSDGPGDGDNGRDGDGDSNGTEQAKRGEVKRREVKRTRKGPTPQPPPEAGEPVGGVSDGDDFEARLTELLDRLGVASGPDAKRRWVIQAERNRNMRDRDDVLRVIAYAVRRGREVMGDQRPNGEQTVNHASDVRHHFTEWRPREPVAAETAP